MDEPFQPLPIEDGRDAALSAREAISLDYLLRCGHPGMGCPTIQVLRRQAATAARHKIENRNDRR